MQARSQGVKPQPWPRARGECSVVLPPPPGPWGDRSSWGKAAEDRSRRVVFQAVVMTVVQVWLFPLSFTCAVRMFEMILLWPQLCLCWLCLPFTIYSNFSCLLSLALCTSSPTCLSSPAQSHLLRADLNICDAQHSNTLVNSAGEENNWPLHCLSSFLSFLTAWDFPGLSESWLHLEAALECGKYKNKHALFLAWQCSKATKSEHL